MIRYFGRAPLCAISRPRDCCSPACYGHPSASMGAAVKREYNAHLALQPEQRQSAYHIESGVDQAAHEAAMQAKLQKYRQAQRRSFWIHFLIVAAAASAMIAGFIWKLGALG